MSGILILLLAVVSITSLFLCRKLSKIRKDTDGNLQQLEELSKLTGEIAHEIKNPLSTIKINLKLIAEDMESSKPVSPTLQNDHSFARAIRKISVIQKEADRLEQILESFLRYADRSKLQLTGANINDIVSDMIDFYLPQAHSHKISIRQYLYGEPLVCKVDMNMLKQTILNLFINAQQAMSNGGELMIRTDRQKNEAVISIGDTGTGIAADRLPYIFDTCRSTRHHGSGLGLPTTKKIVELHKGSIVVNSEQGKGTLFTLKLPLAK